MLEKVLVHRPYIWLAWPNRHKKVWPEFGASLKATWDHLAEHCSWPEEALATLNGQHQGTGHCIAKVLQRLLFAPILNTAHPLIEVSNVVQQILTCSSFYKAQMPGKFCTFVMFYVASLNISMIVHTVVHCALDLHPPRCMHSLDY